MRAPRLALPLGLAAFAAAWASTGLLANPLLATAPRSAQLPAALVAFALCTALGARLSRAAFVSSQSDAAWPLRLEAGAGFVLAGVAIGASIGAFIGENARSLGSG